MSFIHHRSALLKKLWAIAAMTLICIICANFFLQHTMGLHPCVMCIYERCILIVMLILSVVCIITAQGGIAQLITTLAYVVTTIAGIKLSLHHLMLQLHPTPFESCLIFADFPSWMPLDKLLPSYFAASGDCSIDQGNLLGMSMVTWALVIFICYFIFGLCSTWQLANLKKQAKAGA